MDLLEVFGDEDRDDDEEDECSTSASDRCVVVAKDLIENVLNENEKPLMNEKFLKSTLMDVDFSDRLNEKCLSFSFSFSFISLFSSSDEKKKLLLRCFFSSVIVLIGFVVDRCSSIRSPNENETELVTIGLQR